MTPQEAIDFINSIDVDRCGVKLLCEATESFGIAKKALEKQIPKKPQNKKRANDGYAWQWICPNCHIVKITTEHLFCDDCGQALDWSDTE